MLTFSFQLRAKTVMNSASYEYRNISAGRGAQLVPIGMPTICWKTFPPNIFGIILSSTFVNLHLSNKSKRIPFPGTGFRFFFWPHFLQVWSPALSRHSLNSPEDVDHWYERRLSSWLSCHLDTEYGEGR